MSSTVFSFSPTLEDLRAQREEIFALVERYGAYNVRVFGSVARGKASPDSDIDLLVSFREDASIYDISGLWQDLQDFLGRSIDLVIDDHHQRSERFMRRISRDIVTL